MPLVDPTPDIARLGALRCSKPMRSALRTDSLAVSPQLQGGSFATAANLRSNAIVVANDPFFLFSSKRVKIAALAAQYATPAVYEWPEYAHAGGLISYGTSSADVYRKAGLYAGRILKGEKPGDLPVLQPTKPLLVINLKTAKTLGIKVPEWIFGLADEVIE